MAELGSWRVDEQSGELIQVRTAQDVLADRAKQIELEEASRLRLTPPSVVKP